MDTLKKDKTQEQNNPEIVVQQWQTCVDMANAISQRRDTMNNLFVTLNLAIVAVVSVVWDIKSLLLSIAGIILCVVWHLFILYFKKINAVKFDVINRIEQFLPVQPFNDEWKKLKTNSKYIEGTKLELVFPVAFGILYSLVIIIMAVTM